MRDHRGELPISFFKIAIEAFRGGCEQAPRAVNTVQCIINCTSSIVRNAISALEFSYCAAWRTLLVGEDVVMTSRSCASWPGRRFVPPNP